MSLENRHALVCGASQGIGAAVAQRLAADGADITLLARNGDALAALQATLPARHDSRHALLALDLNDTERCADAVAELATERPVNILVNNSGGPAPGPAHGAPTEAYAAAFRQHVIANQVLLQAVLEPMRASGYGRIINIISTSVREPIPGLGVSNTIRGAVASWAKTLSRELGPDDITVNNVLPGYTDTARLRQLLENAAQKKGHDYARERELRLAEVPLGRFAQAEEIAAAVAFLASPDAAYVTGINLTVDGGRSRGA